DQPVRPAPGARRAGGAIRDAGMTSVHPSLVAVDLNLLLAFEALWAERSVTRAGRRLGLSQPAMSGALARLRDMMSDPLFVRGRTELMPTERCAALAAPLAK